MNDLAYDPAAQVLATMESTSGLRQTTCPWASLRDPFVGRVLSAHSWYRDQQLASRLGGRIPEALARGVEVYDAALAIVRAHAMREKRAEREEERARGGAPTRRSLPQFRGRR